MVICKICKSEFTPRRDGRFCSRKCLDKAKPKKVYSFVCEGCGTVRTTHHRTASAMCLPCFNSTRSGDKNPRWKGGYQHYAPGRHGRDKDGLSWKVQRRLAWERDNFTCQHCHIKGGRNPDVHHIIPWPTSLSHALDNLISLCRKCHSIEDGKCHEVWGGQLVAKDVKKVVHSSCPVCGGLKWKRSAKCYKCRATESTNCGSTSKLT